MRARWGVELQGAEGFRAIAALLGSEVDYLRLDAFQLDRLGEAFDLIICFGVLHRVEDPLGLLRVLRRRLDDGGHLLVETYGATERKHMDERGVDAFEAGEVYERDAYVYWGFSRESLTDLAGRAGFGGIEVLDEPVIDGHPRIIGTLAADK